jgi:hypothetical protein
MAHILPPGAMQYFTRSSVSPPRVRQDTVAGKRKPSQSHKLKLSQGCEFDEIFPRPMEIFTGGELMKSVGPCEVVQIEQPITPPGPPEFCGA